MGTRKKTYKLDIVFEIMKYIQRKAIPRGSLAIGKGYKSIRKKAIK